MWTLLGASYWNMMRDLEVVPAGPHKPWDIARGILPAQAMWCYRQALALDPTNQTARLGLVRSLQVHGMDEAERAFSQAQEVTANGPDNPGSLPPGDASREQILERLDELLEHGRVAAATRLISEAGERGHVLDWASSDRVATFFLYLGQPSAARTVWETATGARPRLIG